MREEIQRPEALDLIPVYRSIRVFQPSVKDGVSFAMDIWIERGVIPLGIGRNDCKE